MRELRSSSRAAGSARSWLSAERVSSQAGPLDGARTALLVPGPGLADMLAGVPWPVRSSGEVRVDAPAEQAVSTATAPRATASAARCGRLLGGRGSSAEVPGKGRSVAL